MCAQTSLMASVRGSSAAPPTNSRSSGEIGFGLVIPLAGLFLPAPAPFPLAFPTPSAVASARTATAPLATGGAPRIRTETASGARRSAAGHARSSPERMAAVDDIAGALGFIRVVFGDKVSRWRGGRGRARLLASRPAGHVLAVRWRERRIGRLRSPRARAFEILIRSLFNVGENVTGWNGSAGKLSNICH